MQVKLPAFQFYVGDWLKDPNLRRCSHAAKGVWVDLLCLMFECEERGVLATAGRAWTDEEIAQAVGGDRTVTLSCLQELTLKGVANRNEAGALYSKRMVRDEHKRRLCSEAGKRGGNPTLKGQSKGDAKGKSKRNPTPSSSSSTSSSDKPLLVFVDLPENLDSPEFREAWGLWEQHRREKRQKLTPTSTKQQLQELSEMGQERAVAAIRHSIGKGWTGIYEPHQNGKQPEKPQESQYKTLTPTRAK